MNTKTWLRLGLVAPVVYVFAVVLGGALHPGYSHVVQPISDLIATGAPRKALLDLLFGLYNLLTLAAGWGLWQWMRATPASPRRWAGLLGALCLLAEALFGGITLFFPEDAGGMAAAASISPTGTLHIVFAALSSLTTMLTLLFLGLWFRANAPWRGLGTYSLLSVLFVFLSGGLAAYSVASQLPLAGLIERLTIGGFVLWLPVVAWQLSAAPAPSAPPLLPAG